MVASSDDEYVTLACAFAEAWGSRFVDIGAAGHINGQSGLSAPTRCFGAGVDPRLASGDARSNGPTRRR
jgi:hypothetical protein